MAALRKEHSVFGWFGSNKPRVESDSKRAREYVNRVYRETGGVTPALKQLNDEFLANQQTEKQDERAG